MRIKNKSTKKITPSAVISDLLITIAVIIGLYLIYILFWTGVVAKQAQDQLVQKYHWDIPQNNTQVAPEYKTDFPCDVSPTIEKTMIGRVYIPRFGADYVRNLVEGTNKIRVLDLQGYGHYKNSVMPGCIGNMAAAAHRGGFGESLKWVDKIKKGDAIIIRTQHYWFVYKKYQQEIVMPSHGEVILPIPLEFKSYVAKDAEEVARDLNAEGQEYLPDDKLAARERLLTFTTCHPRYGSKERFIIHAKLDYWSKVIEGVPKELLDKGVKIYS